MKQNEIIYAIREGLKEYVDDTRYTDSYLLYLVNLKRSTYIKREYNIIQKSVDEDVMQIAQNLCMPLELVSGSECPECGFDTDDCEVVRTVDKLPFTIEIKNRNLIHRIAPIGVFKTKFEYVTRERAIYAGEGTYEKNTVYAFYHPNGHIYLKSKQNFYKSLDAISVTAIFEDPNSISKFKGCGSPDSPCYSIDKDRYPIKSWMTSIIINEIIQELTRMKNLPEDEQNNSNDDNG